ncbi:cupin domain-containing protein [Corynebacterium sp. MC-17D]|uniref:cupin domain-containing protein n=1 Tax=Corynebacterium lipophilum TaxID=2804918 RepID=UPI00209554AE|nr:cupin domain-containing protein [Corynebacterium lipophilum]MCZ2117150.1 cupin domain-containing protein [Corynebacterium lipophilum]
MVRKRPDATTPDTPQIGSTMSQPKDDLPVNRPEVFGAAASADSTDHATCIQTINAVAPRPDNARPGVKRLLQGDGVNLIVFNFCPGQTLPDHKSANPITVQCLNGSLEFECGGERFPLKQGEVVHLRAYVPHAVYCPDNALSAGNILLLSMLTGERHGEQDS